MTFKADEEENMEIIYNETSKLFAKMCQKVRQPKETHNNKTSYSCSKPNLFLKPRRIAVWQYTREMRTTMLLYHNLIVCRRFIIAHFEGMSAWLLLTLSILLCKDRRKV